MHYAVNSCISSMPFAYNFLCRLQFNFAIHLTSGKQYIFLAKATFNKIFKNALFIFNQEFPNPNENNNILLDGIYTTCIFYTQDLDI